MPAVDMRLYEENLPVFQEGLRAREILGSADASKLTRAERTVLRGRVHAGDEAFTRIYEATKWVSRRIVREEMSRPRSFHVLLDEEELMQAAMEGVYHMCARADVTRMRSAVNYLMSWIKTSVERAATKAESAYGMTSSQLRLNRKIAAVRARMTRENGAAPTDEEVYEFFHSGKADVQTKYGRGPNPDKTPKVSLENRKITLEQIKAQHEVDSGTPMKFAVTDSQTIDHDTSRLGLTSTDDSRDPMDDNGESITSYWIAYMTEHGIPQEQRDMIAFSLNLYTVNNAGSQPAKPRTARKATSEKSRARVNRSNASKYMRRAEALAAEFTLYMQSAEGSIAQWTSQWVIEHGDGEWLPFITVPVRPDADLFPWFDPDKPVTTGNRKYKHLRVNQS